MTTNTTKKYFVYLEKEFCCDPSEEGFTNVLDAYCDNIDRYTELVGVCDTLEEAEAVMAEQPITGWWHGGFYYSNVAILEEAECCTHNADGSEVDFSNLEEASDALTFSSGLDIVVAELVEED